MITAVFFSYWDLGDERSALHSLFIFGQKSGENGEEVVHLSPLFIFNFLSLCVQNMEMQQGERRRRKAAEGEIAYIKLKKGNGEEEGEGGAVAADITESRGAKRRSSCARQTHPSPLTPLTLSHSAISLRSFLLLLSFLRLSDDAGLLGKARSGTPD